MAALEILINPIEVFVKFVRMTFTKRVYAFVDKDGNIKKEFSVTRGKRGNGIMLVAQRDNGQYCVVNVPKAVKGDGSDEHVWAFSLQKLASAFNLVVKGEWKQHKIGG